MSRTLKLSIIVLNWNRKQDTLDCLASVRSANYPNLDVIVVDNASGDGSVEAVRQAYPETLILQSSINNGLTSNNLGIEAAMQRGADYLLLLNNDTVVDRNCLSRLVEAAGMHHTAGILSPRICYEAHPHLIWYDGGELRINRFGLPTAHHPRFDSDVATAPTDACDVEFVCGCAMLIRRDVIERIGLIDGQFFGYWEDVDLSLRARGAGYTLLHVPSAIVYHKVNRSFVTESPDQYYYQTRNRYLLSRKHAPRARRPRLLFNHLRYCYWEHCKLMDEGKPVQAAAVAEAGWHAMFNHYGRRTERPPTLLLALMKRRYARSRPAESNAAYGAPDPLPGTKKPR